MPVRAWTKGKIMGWTFFDVSPYESTRDIITREFSQSAGVRPDGTDYPAWTVEKLSIQGRTAYAVIRVDHSAGVRYHGAVILFTRKNGEFGYKDMDESMRPYSYGMPLSYLDFLDSVDPRPENDSIAQWRSACRARHALRANERKTRPAYQAGQKWLHAGTGRILELIKSAGPRRGWIVSDGGPCYRRAPFSTLSRFQFMGE